MLGRLLGSRPRLWWWGAHLSTWGPHTAPLLLCPARAIGDKAKGVRDVVQQTANPGYKALKNERRPTNFDKKVLVWAGRFKKEEDIPKYITDLMPPYWGLLHLVFPLLSNEIHRSEVLDAARNSVRIKVCYIMIALTLLGCLAMVITGKEAVKRDNTLLRMNEQKKAKWRAEVEKDQEAAAVKSQ